MTAHRLLGSAVAVLLVGCGGKEPTRDDAATQHDAAPADAPMGSGLTEVNGQLGGVAFKLKYSAVSRGGAGDPRIWVCAADVPVTFAGCQQNSPQGPQPRTVLIGPFTYNNSGVPRWDLSGLGLYRVGSDSLSAYARTGSLTVSEDDPASATLQLTLNIDFGQGTAVTGSVTSP